MSAYSLMSQACLEQTTSVVLSSCCLHHMRVFCRANAPGVLESGHRTSARTTASAAAALQHVKQEDAKTVSVPTRKRDPRGKRKPQATSDVRQGQQTRRGNTSQGNQWSEMPRSYSEGAHQQIWAGNSASPAPEVSLHLCFQSIVEYLCPDVE